MRIAIHRAVPCPRTNPTMPIQRLIILFALSALAALPARAVRITVFAAASLGTAPADARAFAARARQVAA